MTTAREKIQIGLGLDAIGRPVDLNIVDWHVRQQNPSASPSEVQNETPEVIRSLVSEEWFKLGAVSQRHLLLGVEGVETVGGPAALQARHWPQTAPVQDHEVARTDRPGWPEPAN
jgi:hypothetical protein